MPRSGAFHPRLTPATPRPALRVLSPSDAMGISSDPAPAHPPDCQWRTAVSGVCNDRRMWTTAALAAMFLAIGVRGFVPRPRWIAQAAAVIAFALALVAAIVIIVP